MAQPKLHQPVVRFAAIFSQKVATLDWACQQASSEWGDLLLKSEDFDFDSTSYYDASMGKPLRKRLVAFKSLIDPRELINSKQTSNQWESECQSISRIADSGIADSGIADSGIAGQRPVNIDPGYVSEAKVVLATMKDRDHRLYLGDGIFGEVTLYYQLPGVWTASRWTYPDYCLEGYHQFF